MPVSRAEFFFLEALFFFIILVIILPIILVSSCIVASWPYFNSDLKGIYMRPSSTICCQLPWCIILASSCSQRHRPVSSCHRPVSSCHHPVIILLRQHFLSSSIVFYQTAIGSHHLAIILSSSCSAHAISLIAIVFHRFETICIGFTCFSLTPILFYYILCFSTQLLTFIVFSSIW